MAELTQEQRFALIDVAEVLHSTFGTEVTDGVVVDVISGWNANGVKYVDAQKPDQHIRDMSAAAYAAEFYKICGGSLDTSDFDEVTRDCGYVGGLLGSTMLDAIGFDGIKLLATDEAADFARKYPIGDGDYC